MNAPAVVRLAARHLAYLDLAPAATAPSPVHADIRRAVARRELERNIRAALGTMPIPPASEPRWGAGGTGPRAWWGRFVRDHLAADVPDDLNLG
jgi:hypothetical protein